MKNSLQKALSLKVGVFRLQGSLVVVQGDQEESTRNPFWRWSPNRISVRWCWGFTAWPWLVPHQPWSWDCASQQCHHRGVRPPQGRRAGAEIQKHEEGGPGGPEWKEPLLSCSPRATGGGWGVSAIGRLPGLSPAGAAERGRTWPGRRMCQADSHVGWCLAGSVPQCWLGNCLLPLQCPLDAQEQDFVLLCHQAWADPFFFCQKIGKGDLDKGAAAVGCCQTSGFSVWLLKGNLHFLLRLQGEQQFDATLCPLCSSSGLPFSVFLSIHSVCSCSMLNLPSIPTASCRWLPSRVLCSCCLSQGSTFVPA